MDNINMNTAEQYRLYKQAASVPEEAKKPIQSGKLAGFTAINAQWRIDRLTELYGLCGFGWKLGEISYSYQDLPNGERVCLCSLNLYIKVNGEWSEPIHGEGGNKLFASQFDGFEVNDDVQKMAMTDALSVAAKMIGIGAEVYFREGILDSKYTRSTGLNSGGGADVMYGSAQTPVSDEYPFYMGNAPAKRGMTRAEALNVIIPAGKWKGQSVGSVFSTDRRVAEYFASNPNKCAPEVHEAFKLVCGF